MLPSATELSYFYEIATLGSFSKAALRLHITQSSLSMAIGRLEKKLETKLFYRNSTGVTLTRAGEKLFPQIENLLTQWNNIKQQVTAMHHTITGAVTIGCHITMSSYIGPLIAAFLKKYPSIEINLKAASSEILTELVMDSSIDVGIVVNPVEHANLVISEIIQTDFTFWNKDNMQGAQQFNSGETVVIYDPEIPQATTLLKQLASSNLSYARLSKVNGLENVANLTLQGCGIGILPACFVAGVFNGKLRRLKATPFVTNKTCLIYRYENKDILSIKVIIDELRTYIKENFFDLRQI